MSDGGCGESSKQIESCLKKRKSHQNEFAEAIARIAVAQVCESLGFQGFQQSALDKFSDVVCKYIREIGKTSNFYTNLAGRTECNVFDIIQALEDMNLSQGFVGASDRDTCSSASGIIKELSQYVSSSEEITFAYLVPSFPVIKERKSNPSFLQSGEAPPMDEIPPWLPIFPDPETYNSIPSASNEESQTKPDKIEQEHKVRELRSSKSELFWARNESEFPSIFEKGDNPFLVVPLPPGEKAVSLVSLPAKLKEEDTVPNHEPNHGNRVSELDTFSPTNQAVKNSCCYSEEGSRNVLTNNRRIGKMRFQIGKKSLDIAIRDEKSKTKVRSWFVNDEARDEKETRTEELSREPMDIEMNTGNDSVVN